jgi:hypothetical protein
MSSSFIPSFDHGRAKNAIEMCGIVRRAVRYNLATILALQLCAVRAFGSFIDDVRRVPVRIANHVGRQVVSLLRSS